MDNKTILEQAIQKAVENGWKGSPYLDYEKLAGESWLSNMIMGDGIWLVAIVYSPPHDFAKALWGDRHPTTDEYGQPYILNKRGSWQRHLCEMVLAKDPIKYLGENI